MLLKYSIILSQYNPILRYTYVHNKYKLYTSIAMTQLSYKLSKVINLVTLSLMQHSDSLYCIISIISDLDSSLKLT